MEVMDRVKVCRKAESSGGGLPGKRALEESLAFKNASKHIAKSTCRLSSKGINGLWDDSWSVTLLPKHESVSIPVQRALPQVLLQPTNKQQRTGHSTPNESTTKQCVTTYAVKISSPDQYQIEAVGQLVHHAGLTWGKRVRHIFIRFTNRL